MASKIFKKYQYRSNLSMMLRAGMRTRDANTMAKKLTDAQIEEQKDKLRESLEKELRKYGIIV